MKRGNLIWKNVIWAGKMLGIKGQEENPVLFRTAVIATVKLLLTIWPVRNRRRIEIARYSTRHHGRQ